MAQPALMTALGGCTAGAPLMHRAHPLESGEYATAAGVHGYVTPEEAKVAIRRSQRMMAAGGADDPDQLAEGATAAALAAPGVAPYLAVRYGLPKDNEMGIAYTGRRVRVDLRHAFVWNELALGIGAGALGIAPSSGASPPGTPCTNPEVCPEPNIDSSQSVIPGVDARSISGFGVDVPVQLGYQSQPDVVGLWLTLRGKYERHSGELRYLDATGTPSVSPVRGFRRALAAAVGVSVGLRPVRAMLSLETAFEQFIFEVDFADRSRRATLGGFAYTPAAALEFVY